MENKVNTNKLFKKLWYCASIIEKDFEKGITDDVRQITTFFEYHICAHGLSMLINTFENNTDSLGFEISIRTIIESLAILKALNEKELSEKQIALLIYTGLVADIESIRILYNFTKEEGFANYSLDSKKQSIKNVANLLNVSESEAEVLLTTDLFSFLKFNEKNLGRTVSEFIKKELGEECKEIRDFCGLGVHPRFYSPETYEEMHKRRIEYAEDIYYILDYHFDNVVMDEKKAISYQKYKEKYISQENISFINRIKRQFKNSFKNNPGSLDCCSYSFKRIRDLLVDSLLLEELPFFDIGVSRFKTVFEYSAMLYFIKDKETEDCWKFLSDYKANYFLKNHPQSDELDTVAISTKFRFKLNLPLEEIKKNLLRNDLYFLEGRKMRYMPFVKNASDALLKNLAFEVNCGFDILKPEDYEYFYSMYKSSLNETHPHLGFVKNITKSRTSVHCLANYIFVTYVYTFGKNNRMFLLLLELSQGKDIWKLS